MSEAFRDDCEARLDKVRHEIQELKAKIEGHKIGEPDMVMAAQKEAAADDKKKQGEEKYANTLRAEANTLRQLHATWTRMLGDYELRLFKKGAPEEAILLQAPFTIEAAGVQ